MAALHHVVDVSQFADDPGPGSQCQSCERCRGGTVLPSPFSFGFVGVGDRGIARSFLGYFRMKKRPGLGQCGERGVLTSCSVCL